MQIDDDFHKIIKTLVIEKKIPEPRREGMRYKFKDINNAIVFMSDEEVNLLYLKKSAFIDIYYISDEFNKYGFEDQLRSLNFKNIIGKIYVGITYKSFCDVPCRIHIRQGSKAWQARISKNTRYASDTIPIYLIKYIDGKVADWDATDDILDFTIWRKFYRDTVCAREDPFNPDAREEKI